MLQLLEGRRVGLEPVWLAPRVYGSSRMAALELSTEKEVDRAHYKGVNALDLDPSSFR